ncbi:DNA polymerase III subunit beta [Candidatus Beckwithbacteria bacterium]|nr:DNA polymerase III subunit beta [Candidatus Beckwithbacteria bacterium]
MKISLNNSSFKKALQISLRIIKNNPQLPILNNALLKIKNNNLEIRATDLNSAIMVNVKIENKEKGKEGVYAINVGTILEYLQTLRDGVVFLNFTKDKIIVEQKQSKASFPLVDFNDYPDFKIEETEQKILIKAEKFNEALKKTTPSVATDDSRPILTGILFHQEGNLLQLIGTDGFRLSLSSLEFEGGWERDLVIPAKLLLEIIKDIEGENISLGFDKTQGQLWIRGEDRIVSIRILQGDYPNFRKIIPESFSLKITGDKEDLLFAVKQMAVFARQSANIVKWEIEKKKLKMLTQANFSGEGEVSVDINQEGDGLIVGFNFHYLLDFFNLVENGITEITFNGSLAPVVLRNKEDKNLLHIIMPVKLD